MGQVYVGANTMNKAVPEGTSLAAYTGAWLPMDVLEDGWVFRRRRCAAHQPRSGLGTCCAWRAHCAAVMNWCTYAHPFRRITRGPQRIDYTTEH